MPKLYSYATKQVSCETPKSFDCWSHLLECSTYIPEMFFVDSYFLDMREVYMSRSSYWGEAVKFIKQQLPSHFKMLKSQFLKKVLWISST